MVIKRLFNVAVASVLLLVNVSSGMSHDASIIVFWINICLFEAMDIHRTIKEHQ